MSDNNTIRRVKTLQAVLAKQRTDALIITKGANVTYLTGFLGDDCWAVVTGQRTYLMTDSRYTEQAHKECVGCTIIERKGAMMKAVAQILARQKKVKNVGLEDSVSLAVFSALKKNVKGQVKKVSEIVEELREVKDEDEVELIRKAAQIAQVALAETTKYIKPGVSENELAGLLNLNIRRMGGRESFETIVAFGPNASQPHHISGDRKLKRNDTVLIDWGVKYKGYCCDLTRSFAVGKAGRLFEKVYNAVLEAQQAAIAKVKDGVAIAEVDGAAREVLKKYKLPVYGHGTGHGLGLEVHESPVVSTNMNEKLQAGQLITIEPGVYMPGVLGVRIEDDVLVTKDGCVVLSGRK